MEFTESDYPGLFRSTDQISISAQQKYVTLFRAELFVLILGAIVGSFNITDTSYGKYIAMCAAFFFITGLALSVYIKQANLENHWYIGRAIAESIKSMTWRYVTKGEPYHESISEGENKKKFIAALKEILVENKQFITDISTDNDNAVSPKMTTVRGFSLTKRKDFYLKNRVKEQLDWYRRKSKTNQKMNNQYFSILVVFYLIAIIYHLVLIADNTLFNAAPIVATLVGCVLSWTKMKQYQELSQSYAVTANEITLILNEGAEVVNEIDFQTFVGDAEAAFSREHTLWLARRDAL